MKSIVLSILSVFIATGAAAQTVISFENKDYKAVSVYDAWEKSPFRKDAETGKQLLKGNAAVVSNFLKDRGDTQDRMVNTSKKILGFQRSRYGSNLYGVRIDLKEPVRVTKQNQYIHVMTYMEGKPTPSRMMVIGLGKRVEKEWAWQDGSDEQFWAVSNNDVSSSDRWQDEVFAFRGFSYAKDEHPDKGIDIYSLVIVPDVASRSDMAQDFACYFDSIVVDNNPAKRFSTTYYATPSGKPYKNLTLTHPFTMKAGDKTLPSLTSMGGQVSGKLSVDWNCDGFFAPSEQCGRVGASAADCQMPAGVNPGLYRMRIESDKDGSIVDIMLNVQGAVPLMVTQSGLNGDVLDADGHKLDKTRAASLSPFRISMKPAPGFRNGGITVRYGYDTGSDEQLDQYGNPKWFRQDFPASRFSSSDGLTLPADIMIGGSVGIESHYESTTK